MTHIALNQGGKFYENIKKKVKQTFSIGQKEGFDGILGSNQIMDYAISSETKRTNESATNLNDNIAQYGTDYKALQKKTTQYLNDKSNDYELKKNYNVFINKASKEGEIPATNQKGCVTKDSINNLTLASGFTSAYPNNFPDYKKAETACKLWAADSKQKVFAVNQDNTGKYQCYTGDELGTNIVQYTKPATLYKVLTGDSGTVQGGLFGNGQIGVWTGQTTQAEWNITNMTKPTLIKKYNSNDYSSGPQGIEAAFQAGWWGMPSKGGWGVNLFPNDVAWWISTSNYTVVGTMGYFYYLLNSPNAKHIGLYWVNDDDAVVKLNGNIITGTSNLGWAGKNVGVNLQAGKNVFEINLINGGGPGALVFYAYEGYTNKILFKSGDDGWGISSKPVSDYNLITNSTTDQTNPSGMKVLNSVPSGFANCDPIVGGGVNKNNITASYGRNCSNDTQPPLNVRYVTYTPNDTPDYLQVASLAVYAIVDGNIVNVAPKGTATSSAKWQYGGNFHAGSPVNGNLNNHLGFHSSHPPSPDAFWKLDLGRDYQVKEIVYWNRGDCCAERAKGTKLKVASTNGDYQFFTLTSGMVQKFVVSSTYAKPAPYNVGGAGWNGYSYTKNEAKDICAAKGARLCHSGEIMDMNVCACGWTENKNVAGYPMATGDPTPQGWCGGSNNGIPWRNCGWTTEGRGQAYCCK
jgi:hypothetical protein